MSNRPGLFETLYTSRALRRFKPDPIPDEVLFQMLDAAIRAPSGQNAQDWRFLVVRDRETLQTFQRWSQVPWERYRARYGDDASIDALPRSQRLSLRSVEHLVNHIGECPAVVIVTGMRGRHGTPGGSTIITSVVQVIVNTIDHGMNIAEATHQPRIYQGWTDTLRVEPNFNPDTVALLRRLGHTITSDETMGSAQSIMIENDLFLGAADPRRPGALAIAP